MSAESYVESVRSQIAERAEKVEFAVDMLRRIVRNHATFDEFSVGKPMEVPAALWDQDRPNDAVYFNLYDNGERIDQASITSMETKEYMVSQANFELSPDGNNSATVMTIMTHPPNVLGYDGAPLNSSQLDGAIIDLHRYENALIEGRLEG